MTEVTSAEIAGALHGTPWHLLAGALHASYAVGSLAAGVRFAGTVSDAADAAGHHPDVDLRYTAVHLRLVSHDVGVVTTRDLSLALTIAVMAREQDLEPAPGAPQVLEIAVDALDIPRVRPFWSAALGYVDGPATEGDVPDLRDPRGTGAPVWFQQMSSPRPQRNRIHLDVWVARDEVDERLAAVLDAGGTLVSDASAPQFWIVADPEGNEVCLCTPEGRP